LIALLERGVDPVALLRGNYDNGKKYKAFSLVFQAQYYPFSLDKPSKIAKSIDGSL
jgi:hypothetical protein